MTEPLLDPVQGEWVGSTWVPPGRVPREVYEIAYRAYARRYGRQQSLERLLERGGFSWTELCMYFLQGKTIINSWDAPNLQETLDHIAGLDK